MFAGTTNTPGIGRREMMGGMGGMGLWWILILVLVILAIAALVKYLRK